MNTFRKLLPTALGILLAAGSLGAQTSLPGALTAEGTGSGPDFSSARNAAVSQALDRAFTQNNKDTLFRRLFVSDMGIYSTIEVREDPPSKNPITGTHTLRVTVVVAPDAMSAIQNKYTEAVSALLTDGEKEILSVVKLLEAGNSALKNESFSQAWNLFSEARDRAGAVQRQLAGFTDQTIRSDASSTKEVIEKRLQLRIAEADDALARLKEIEKAALQGQSQKDLFQAYGVFEAGQKDLSSWVSRRMDQAPFYEVPPEEIRKILLEWETRAGALRDLEDQYSRLQSLSGGVSLLFQARLSQSRRDLEGMRKGMDSIRSDLESELKNPRLARAEKERESALFWAGVRESLVKGVAGALLRESGENGALRIFFPLQVVNGEAEITNFLPLSAKLEGRYSGLWLMTRFLWESRDYTDGIRMNSSLSQTLAAGFGDPWIIGAGWQWDWRRVSTRGFLDDPLGLPARSRIHVYFGMVDKDLGWPFWMLDGWYEIPGPEERPDFASLVNLGAEGVLRFGRWVKMEGGAFSRTLGLPGNLLEREAGFRAGGGFKLPNSLLWGIGWENSTTTRLSDGAYRSRTIWEFYVEYSF